MQGEFPIDINGYNQGVSDPTSRQYYADQSQTVLATRAASQLDYDKIQDQIAYQQMLQQKIDNTDELKSALDLNNRIQVESNLINLEILRQSHLESAAGYCSTRQPNTRFNQRKIFNEAIGDEREIKN